MAEAPQHLFVSEIERLESLMHDGHQGLYWDPDALDGKGSRIITHSMLKQFRKCPLCSYFKYVLRLKPKMLAKPLKRGTWVHALLEEYANGGDWEALHAKYTDQFNRLFDEEKDYYGDMPTEIYTIVKSYMWHYKRDVWKYVANEFTMETPFPDGTLYRCKVDMLIENAFGLWLGDRKTHKTLPDQASESGTRSLPCISGPRGRTACLFRGSSGTTFAGRPHRYRSCWSRGIASRTRHSTPTTRPS